jgi:hypothetical protein
MAKELIADAESLSLPPVSGAGSVTHGRHRKPYHYKVPELSSPFTIVLGWTEKKVSPGWICDALCMGQSNVGVAVEVRYMNLKSTSDIEKFQQHDIPVVEIDVRELDTSWSLEKVRHWVLFEAPRKWLHCPPLIRAEQQARQDTLTCLLEHDYSRDKPERRNVRMQAQRQLNRQGALPRFESAIIRYEKGDEAYIKMAPIYARRESGLSHLNKLPQYQPALVTVKKRDINPKFGWSGTIQIENERVGGVREYPFYYIEKRNSFDTLSEPEGPYAIVYDDESKRYGHHIIRFQNVAHWVEKLTALYRD